MKKKKILLVILLGIVTFLEINIECEANDNPLKTWADGASETVGGGQNGCPPDKESCWGGASGSTITIKAVEGSNFKSVEFFLDNSQMDSLGWNKPANFETIDSDPEHSKQWKEAISGLAAVVKNEKKASPLQNEILKQMAEANNMSLEDFKVAYKTAALKNESIFEYKDTPTAKVCINGTNDCTWYSTNEYSKCITEKGDNYGCYAIILADGACGKIACTGNDKGLINTTCMEIYNDTYTCCKIEKGENSLECCEQKFGKNSSECCNIKYTYECCIKDKGEDSLECCALKYGKDSPECKKQESCMQKYHDWNKCCVEFYGEDSPKCNKGGGGGNTIVEPGTCDPPEMESITYPSLVLIPNEPDGSVGCGTSYTTYSYDYGTTECEYVNTLITTVRTEEYPEISGTYEAGEQFNFSNTVYWHSTRTERVWDDSKLKNELVAAKNVESSLVSQKKCLENSIDEYKEAISELTCYDEYIDESCKNKCDQNLPDEEYKACVDDCVVPEDCTEKERLEKKYKDEIKKLQNQIDDINPQISEAQARIAELNACSARANSFQTKSSSSSGSYTLNGTYLSLGKYQQTINSIKAIAKNSGQLLTQNELNNFEFPYLLNKSNFVIPIETKNGTSGSVVTSLYSCPIDVRNMLLNGGLNLIYRPISLTNPFPNIRLNGGYRAMGANWNETYAETRIKNNRGVSDYDVYQKTPIYTIKLDATKIKEIRKYNKTTSFNNFDMQCTDGYLCKSNFLWGTTANGYDFSDIIVQSESCATASGWNACYGGAD